MASFSSGSAELPEHSKFSSIAKEKPYVSVARVALYDPDSPTTGGNFDQISRNRTVSTMGKEDSKSREPKSQSIVTKSDYTESYECDVCSATFQRKSYLTRHMTSRMFFSQYYVVLPF
jgi:hypothetical protein